MSIEIEFSVGGRDAIETMGWFARLFSSRFELNGNARDWIHSELKWLQDEFGTDRLIERPVIEPTDAFFPDPYDHSPAAVERLLGRVCYHMEVAPETVQLKTFRNDQKFYLVGEDGVSHGVAGGTYRASSDRFIIRIDEAALQMPAWVVGTLAHELSHARLMGEHRIDPSRFDNELLTDLCSIYFGFGIFCANHPAYAPPGRHVWPGTTVGRSEYMSLPMIAYTLALIADIRYETRPTWARYLRGAAKAEFRAASAALAKRY